MLCVMHAYLMLLYLMLFVCIMLFLPLSLANAFCLHALSWFIDTVCLFQALFCIIHRAFNLLAFHNSMFTPLF